MILPNQDDEQEQLVRLNEVSIKLDELKKAWKSTLDYGNGLAVSIALESGLVYLKEEQMETVSDALLMAIGKTLQANGINVRLKQQTPSAQSDRMLAQWQQAMDTEAGMAIDSVLKSGISFGNDANL